MSKQAAKDDHMQFRISPELKAQFKQACAERQALPSMVMRHLIEQWLAAQPSAKAARGANAEGETMA